jgi:hypothetical protein
MSISIVFENPLYISMGETSDEISISVINNTVFESSATGKLIDIVPSQYKKSLLT